MTNKKSKVERPSKPHLMILDQHPTIIELKRDIRLLRHTNEILVIELRKHIELIRDLLENIEALQFTRYKEYRKKLVKNALAHIVVDVL